MAPCKVPLDKNLCPPTLLLRPIKHKRRFCRVEGCSRIVKSQGVCQRHGAKPKLCRLPGCAKQAQGNFDGMCKSHFKAQTEVAQYLKPSSDPMSLESVYDRILPATLYGRESQRQTIPLADYIFEGLRSLKPPGWHRNEERLSFGLDIIVDLTSDFEPWEKDLLTTELLLLTGSRNAASFDAMAHAWGKQQGFHTMVLAEHIQERRGDNLKKIRQTKGSYIAPARTSFEFFQSGASQQYEDYDKCCHSDVTYPLDSSLRTCQQSDAAVVSICDTVQPLNVFDTGCSTHTAYDDAEMAADIIEIFGNELKSNMYPFPFLTSWEGCAEVSSVSDDGSTSSESVVVEAIKIPTLGISM